MTTTIELCTSGPFSGIIESKARELGIPISPYRFVRQQDITLNGVQVFPRIWEGKSHTGANVKETINGGWPGLHDHEQLRRGSYSQSRRVFPSPDSREVILDLEPENWQVWLKSGDTRQVVDAFDVVRTTVDAAGAVAVAFCIYPEMYNKLWFAVGQPFADWWNALPLHTPDAYWYDRPGEANPWTPSDYEAEVAKYFYGICRGIPASRIRPFRSLCTSGDYRPMTEAEERFTTTAWAKYRVTNFLLWVGCDTHKEALASAALMTPERIAWMREGVV